MFLQFFISNPLDPLTWLLKDSIVLLIPEPWIIISFLFSNVIFPNIGKNPESKNIVSPGSERINLSWKSFSNWAKQHEKIVRPNFNKKFIFLTDKILDNTVRS